MASEWELVATLRISGKTRGADGMAFWFTRELIQEGRVFGGSDKWHGLMVAVDTYPNVKGKVCS